jgi:hypothetical protein
MRLALPLQAPLMASGSMLALGRAVDDFAAGAAGWFNAPEFADLAAIADFNADRYAIPAVPAGNILTATAAELCVKRACSFAEWFAFKASSTSARSYSDANGIWRNDLAVDQPRFEWINGRRQLGLNAQSVNTCNSSMVGGVAGVLGSGGVLPAGWTVGFNSSLTVTVSYPTVNGLPVCRIRVAGTPNTSGGQYIRFEPQAVVASGAVSAGSAFLALSAGSLSGVTAELRNTSTQFGTNLTLNATLSRAVRLLTHTSTDAQLCIRFGFPNTTTAQDFTLDIAVPQREPDAVFASAPIIGPAGTTRAIETAELSPVLEAILQRSAATMVVRGEKMLRGQGTFIGVNGSSALLRSTLGGTQLAMDGSSTLVTGNPSLTWASNRFGVVGAFDASARRLRQSAGGNASDAGTPPTRIAAYLGRSAESAPFGDGWYDFVGIAPSRLSDARLTELAVAA